MLSRRSFRAIFVALLTALAGSWLSDAPLTVERGLTPFGGIALPQQAVGDFDGDGRTDVAAIQARASGARVSVLLSGTSERIELDEPVAGVVEGDIDADGDLDLIAATVSGEMVVWLNDGHGRFTRQSRPRGRGMTGTSTLARGWQQRTAALNRVPPHVAGWPRNARGALVAWARAPAPPQPLGYAFLPTIAVRAPPASDTDSI